MNGYPAVDPESKGSLKPHSLLPVFKYPMKMK